MRQLVELLPYLLNAEKVEGMTAEEFLNEIEDQLTRLLGVGDDDVFKMDRMPSADIVAAAGSLLGQIQDNEEALEEALSKEWGKAEEKDEDGEEIPVDFDASFIRHILLGEAALLLAHLRS